MAGMFYYKSIGGTRYLCWKRQYIIDIQEDQSMPLNIDLSYIILFMAVGPKMKYGHMDSLWRF